MHQAGAFLTMRGYVCSTGLSLVAHWNFHQVAHWNFHQIVPIGMISVWCPLADAASGVQARARALAPAGQSCAEDNGALSSFGWLFMWPKDFAFHLGRFLIPFMVVKSFSRYRVLQGEASVDV